MSHWIERAERVHSSRRLVGEDERGDLFAPSRSVSGWWDEPLDLRKPRHLAAWVNSRLRRQIVWLERP